MLPCFSTQYFYDASSNSVNSISPILFMALPHWKRFRDISWNIFFFQYFPYWKSRELVVFIKAGHVFQLSDNEYIGRQVLVKEQNAQNIFPCGKALTLVAICMASCTVSNAVNGDQSTLKSGSVDERIRTPSLSPWKATGWSQRCQRRSSDQRMSLDTLGRLS